MIKTYFVEDVTIEQLDDLIEKGECFDLVSKTTLSSEDTNKQYRDLFWGFRDRPAENLRNNST